MLVCQLFYLSVIIGMCTGVCVTFAQAGFMGIMKHMVAIPVSLITGSIGGYALVRLLKRIRPVWGFAIEVIKS